MLFAVSDVSQLYAAWMPFIKGGGLFIPTGKKYLLGEAVTVSLSLFDESDIYSIPGIVVWLAPFGTQTDSPGGVGVQFNDTQQNQMIKHRIENLLENYPHNDQPTNTL